MIDIKLVRENPELIKENIKKKFQNEKLVLVDKIIKLDEEWRKLKYEGDSLRSERNKISQEINQAKKQKKDAKALIKKAKEIPNKLKKLEDKEKKLETEIKEIILKLPNIMHPKVPKGKTDKDNVELRKWGKPRKFDFKVKNHVELIESLNMGDFEAGRSNSGQGFNYLLKDVAQLDYALQRYGMDFAIKKGFVPVVPPMLLNFKTLLGALNGLQDFEEVVYKLDKEDLYLIGTAEHTLVSMLKNKVLNKKNLPLKICAATPCFRKEIGSHGVDTKGLFRMHQFNKVEQVVFTTPKDSSKMLEEMQKITEEFLKTLKIPFRVVELCSGDLGDKFTRQYDIEAWFPRQKAYREITSAGHCSDFQARALNIKYLDKEERKHVHILNNTMIATSRAMVTILENNQQKDGSIKIPTPLQKYMNNQKIIKKN